MKRMKILLASICMLRVNLRGRLLENSISKFVVGSFFFLFRPSGILFRCVSELFVVLRQGGRPGAMHQCKQCKGSGVKVIIRPLGPGMVQQMQTTCPDCHGEGQTMMSTCFSFEELDGVSCCLIGGSDLGKSESFCVWCLCLVDDRYNQQLI